MTGRQVDLRGVNTVSESPSFVSNRKLYTNSVYTDWRCDGLKHCIGFISFIFSLSQSVCLRASVNIQLSLTH